MRTLAGKDIDGGRLSDLRGALEDLPSTLELFMYVVDVARDFCRPAGDADLVVRNTRFLLPFERADGEWRTGASKPPCGVNEVQIYEVKTRTSGLGRLPFWTSTSESTCMSSLLLSLLSLTRVQVYHK